MVGMGHVSHERLLFAAVTAALFTAHTCSLLLAPESLHRGTWRNAARGWLSRSRTRSATLRRTSRHRAHPRNWRGRNHCNELLLRLGAHHRKQRKPQRIGHVFNRGTVPESRNRRVHRAVQHLERVLIVRAMLNRDFERSADALLVQQALFAGVRAVVRRTRVGGR